MNYTYYYDGNPDDPEDGHTGKLKEVTEEFVKSFFKNCPPCIERLRTKGKYGGFRAIKK